MSEPIERRLRQVPGDFPRPDPATTRLVEKRLQARLRSSRNRRGVRPALFVLLPLVVGTVLGAGAVAVTAGAASERVTLAIRPTILRDENALAFGTVSNGRAGEDVVLEVRECGQSDFRVFAGATTRGGGAYEADVGDRLWISGVVRARWKGSVSDRVEVKRRANVWLKRVARSRFEVGVAGQRYFDGRRVRIERWNRVRERWAFIREVKLKRGWSAGVFLGSLNEFRLSVLRGTLLRAVFPTAQARPCYVEGVSKIVRS